MRRIDDHEGLGRHYECSHGIFPSVTTILRATADRRGLDFWRRKVGHEYAEAVKRAAAERGSKLHLEIEDSLFLGDLPRHPSPWLESLRPQVLQCMNAKDRVTEQGVYSKKHEYAGTLDTLAELDGRIVLWDWKTYLPSDEAKRADPKPKKPAHLEDYLLQTRAYAKAAGSTLYRTVDEIRVAIARCAVRGDVLVPLPAQVVVVSREDDDYGQLWKSFSLRLALWRVQVSTMKAGA